MTDASPACQCCFCQGRSPRCSGCLETQDAAFCEWRVRPAKDVMDELVQESEKLGLYDKEFGRKNDSFGQPGQKARYDLLPWQCINEVVEVLTHGATKYGDENWAKVDKYVPRYFSAAMRHLVAWMTGEKIDPESGKSHLAHAVASILFLMARDRR